MTTAPQTTDAVTRLCSDGASSTHLAGLLAFVRHLLRRFYDRHRARFVESPAGMLHTFVTAKEMKAYLANTHKGTPEVGDDVVQLLADDVAETAQRAEAMGDLLPMRGLAEHLQLDDAACWVMACVAAPELSVDVQRAYRYAYADFTARFGTALFYEELLAEAGVPAEATYRWLSPTSPLVRYGLISLGSGEGTASASTSARAVSATDRLVSILREGSARDPILPGCIEVRTGTPPTLRFAGDTFQRARRAVAAAVRSAADRRRIVLHGPDGSGRRSLIHTLLGGAVILDALAVPPGADVPALWREALCEARVSGRGLAVVGLDIIAASEATDPRAALFDLVRVERRPVFVVGERMSSDLLERLGGDPTAVSAVAVPFPPVELQQEMWTQYLPAGARFGPDVPTEEIAGRYNLTGGKIRASLAQAVAQARVESAGAVLGLDALDIAVRSQLATRLGDLVTRVTTPYTLEDLVVPAAVTEQLDEILVFYRRRNALLHDWGFQRKLGYGRGISVLLHGPPGTGKTMTAVVLARALGMEIFRVDLSQVVDKYIGETEKRMARIFREAGRGHALLLFDEADSLFAKRTEVKSSTDRYANLSVNFLLQRMEDYEGVTVLTTNLESAIDPAFRRRIRFKVTYPAPTAANREQLWASMIPEEAPTEGDLDFRYLAEEFELVGADIKTVVVKASARAIEDRAPLTYERLRDAARALYKERGKIVRERDEW